MILCIILQNMIKNGVSFFWYQYQILMQCIILQNFQLVQSVFWCFFKLRIIFWSIWCIFCDSVSFFDQPDTYFVTVYHFCKQHVSIFTTHVTYFVLTYQKMWQMYVLKFVKSCYEIRKKFWYTVTFFATTYQIINYVFLKNDTIHQNVFHSQQNLIHCIKIWYIISKMIETNIKVAENCQKWCVWIIFWYISTKYDSCLSKIDTFFFIFAKNDTRKTKYVI